MKEHVKFTGILLLVGGVLGLLASMWWGPQLISWWWMPPSGGGVISTVCGDQVKDAARALVQMQLITGAALGVVIAIVGNWVAYKRRHRFVTPTAPTQAPTP